MDDFLPSFTATVDQEYFTSNVAGEPSDNLFLESDAQAMNTSAKYKRPPIQLLEHEESAILSLGHVDPLFQGSVLGSHELLLDSENVLPVIGGAYCQKSRRQTQTEALAHPPERMRSPLRTGYSCQKSRKQKRTQTPACSSQLESSVSRNKIFGQVADEKAVECLLFLLQ